MEREREPAGDGLFDFFPSSLLLTMLLSVISCASDATTFKGIDLENPVIEVTPFPLAGYTFSWFQRRLLCERVRVAGKSRLKLGSYANAYQVTVAPSAVIPEKLHKKIQICFHQNASRGLCQCEKDEWRAVENWIWSSVMSPSEDRYVDLKFVGEFSGSMTVTVEEEFRRWRLFCFIAVGTSCHWLGSILLQQFNGYWSFACHYYPSFSDPHH